MDQILTPPSHHSVIVVGGGQAGLSMSYQLRQHGIDHIVFEKSTIAHAWKTQRWDSFCLVTPNWQCQLPGFPYPGAEPHGFMPKDEIVRYIEAYARAIEAPVAEGVTVTSIRRRAGGGFAVATSGGDHTADQVVMAISGYHVPSIPAFSARLPAKLRQIHSSTYRNPGQMADGAVLVVGSGQSGCQIAEDLHLAGRKVHLVVGSCAALPAHLIVGATPSIGSPIWASTTSPWRTIPSRRMSGARPTTTSPAGTGAATSTCAVSPWKA